MTEYEQLLASRAALQKEKDQFGLQDESQDTTETPSAVANMKANPTQVPPEQGGELSKAGDATTMAGASAGNPYVAGAGLALKTVGAVDDAHRQAEQAKIQAYNNKIMAQRSAIRNIFA